MKSADVADKVEHSGMNINTNKFEKAAQLQLSDELSRKH